MRLSEQQQQAIREEVARVFGPKTLVRLFGSRVDDQARGGDIDLHIETSGAPGELVERELQLHARLLRRLGERKIDIVVCSDQATARPVDKQAIQTGVVL